MKLGLREANQQFSKAIRAVRAGKEVLLTERGQPIAIIKPLSDAHAPDAALARMADEGLILLPSRKGPLPGFRPVPNRREPVSRTIIDEREDRA